MTELETREITPSDIVKYCKDNESIFRYVQNSDKVLESKQGAVTKDNLISAYHRNMITQSDLFICLALAKLTVGTERMILSIVRYLKNTLDKELSIPDEAGSKHRLSDLVKHGFIYEFNYKRSDVNNKNQRYYVLTEHAYSFLTRVLEYNEPYDQFFSIIPLDEVVKYLSVNNVISRVVDSIPVDEFKTKDKIFLKDIRSLEYFYGKFKTTIKKESGEKKYVVFVEPIFFTYDKGRKSKEAYEEGMKTRLSVMKASIDMAMGSKRDPYLLVVVEDFEGMLKAMEYMSKVDNTLCLNYMYFTTEYLVSKFGIKNSCFVFKGMVEGTPKISHRQPKFC